MLKGTDANRNGRLDDEEVTDTSYLCSDISEEEVACMNADAYAPCGTRNIAADTGFCVPASETSLRLVCESLSSAQTECQPYVIAMRAGEPVSNCCEVAIPEGDVVTDDETTDDSATDDSAADDSTTDDSATDDSAPMTARR